MDPAVSNDETHVASANTEMLSGAKIESDDGQATVIDQDDEQIIEAIGEFYDSAR